LFDKEAHFTLQFNRDCRTIWPILLHDLPIIVVQVRIECCAMGDFLCYDWYSCGRAATLHCGL